MPAHLVPVAHGRPAAEALRRAVAEAKGGDPLQPVTVVVPSNTVGVAARRQLASGRLGEVVAGRPGLAAVGFVTVFRLAELLGATALAASGRRPVSTPVLAAAVRHVLAADPGVFAPVAAHPATEEALVDAHRELRDLSPEALSSLAASGRRAADVVRIHRAATAALATSWYDEHDLLAAATAAIGAGAPGVAELGPVVVHLPQVLTRSAGRLLAALPDVTVVAALTGHPAADADVLGSLARAGVDAVAAERAAARAASEPATPAPSRLISVSDADEEARAAVRLVVDAAREGTPLDRTAILHPVDQPYARLVHEHLAAAAIPHNGPSVKPLRERVAGRTLLALLALGDDVGFRRDAVFDLLSSLPAPAPPSSPLPVARWEALSRDAGVVAGLDQWDARLAAHAARLRRLGDDGAADLADDLRSTVGSLADRLDIAGPASWRDRCERLSALLHDLVGPPGTRHAWPLDEQRAADRVDAVLSRLATLDTVEPDPSEAAVRRTIELELDADAGRDGRLGDGVVTGSLGTGLGLDLDLVVVLGLAEGTLPGTQHDDALLPDHERRAAGGELRLRSSRLGTQHRQLLAALAAGATTVMVIPRGDLRRSAERVVSRWAAAAEVPVEVVPSHAATLTAVGSPSSPAEIRVRALAALGGDPGPHHPLVESDDALRLGGEVVRARASSRFTRFDGNLGDAVGRLGLPRPTDDAVAVSPTALQTWVSCPFHYFVRQVLHVREVENPEDRVVISPLDYGTLVHAILEDHVREGSANEPDADRAAAALAAIAERHCREAERKGITGHPLYWEQRTRRLLADLDTHARLDRERLDRLAATAVHAELRFGRSAALDAVTVDLPSGASVRFTGSIDRIDRSADGRLWVIDHKTGKSERYRSSIADGDPLAGGTHLQLPVYALAARSAVGDPTAPVRATYSFPTRVGGFCEVGVEVTDELLAVFVAVVERIVAGIEAGVFVARPEPGTRPFVTCSSCDPDGLGTGDRRHEWEHKCLDPGLADYVRLVEPEALDRV